MPEPAVLEPPAKMVLGVCAMDKKARSKPMREILARMLAFNEFEVVVFGDQVSWGALRNNIQLRCHPRCCLHG
jgi:hypothetical protein